MTNHQQGVSLIITFLVMTILIAMVLAISTILFNEVVIIRDTGTSTISFDAANTGIEKTLYFDRKKIPSGGFRGICDICNSCKASGDPSVACSPCTPTGTDCNPLTCTSCIIDFGSTFTDPNVTYSVNINTSQDPDDTNLYHLILNSKGAYKGINREINISMDSVYN